MKLYIDDRIANLGSDVELECQGHEEAIAALGMLNGQEHTLLSIERADGWQLCVGGGAGNFIVTLSSKDDDNFTLLNTNGDGGDFVELCAGGQFSDYPTNIVVGRAEASSAIRHFFSGKEMGVSWEKS